jgi:hypothetical protein
MPFVNVKLIEGVLDADQKRRSWSGGRTLMVEI